MHDPREVGDGERPRHLGAHVRQLLDADGPAGPGRERSSLDELHGQKTAVIEIADLIDRDDVGMVEGGGGASFLLETAHRVGVARESGLQQLDGDFASQPGIVREVDLAHAATADERHDVIGPDAAAQRPARLGVLLGRDQSCGDVHRRTGNEIAGLGMRAQQRVHLTAQFVVAGTGDVEEAGTLLERQIECRMIELPDALILFGGHDSPRSSRYSQARARLQSRRTVPTDTSSTCAVSSRLRPAKNRNSTTRLWRGSSASRRPSASSSWTEIDAVDRGGHERGLRERDL